MALSPEQANDWLTWDRKHHSYYQSIHSADYTLAQRQSLLQAISEEEEEEQDVSSTPTPSTQGRRRQKIVRLWLDAYKAVVAFLKARSEREEEEWKMKELRREMREEEKRKRASQLPDPEMRKKQFELAEKLARAAREEAKQARGL